MARSCPRTAGRRKSAPPRLGEAITFSLRKRLQQDGTYSLNTSDAGDIIVNGTIIAAMAP